MQSVQYQVQNISCQHCIHTIEAELSELEGVSQVRADQDARTVSLAFEPPASEEGIKALLAEINYPVMA